MVASKTKKQEPKQPKQQREGRITMTAAECDVCRRVKHVCSRWNAGDVTVNDDDDRC